MFTVAWAYMFATYLFLWAGMLLDPVWIYVAVGLCFVQLVHFGVEDKNFFSFTCQVRLGLAAILALAATDSLRWVGWIPVAGLTVRLTTDYCPLARILSLLPWNRKKPMSRELLMRTFFSKPVRGSFLANQA